MAKKKLHNVKVSDFEFVIVHEEDELPVDVLCSLDLHDEQCERLGCALVEAVRAGFCNHIFTSINSEDDLSLGIEADECPIGNHDSMSVSEILAETSNSRIEELEAEITRLKKELASAQRKQKKTTARRPKRH